MLVGVRLSVSAKLAGYEETKELLGRLKVRELKQLALQNNTTLEKEDWTGKARTVKTKEEIIEILVNSEFKEHDLVELLGLSRLTNRELLSYMPVRQLRGLAKEYGVALRKSTLLGEKKATKKGDMVDVLESHLSPPKVRRYIQNMSLIQKRLEREAAKKRKVKKRRKPKKIGLPDIRKQGRFVQVLNTSHALKLLLALDALQKPSTLHEIKGQIHQIEEWPSSGQLRYVAKSLVDLDMVKREYETKGERFITRYQTTDDGNKFIKAMKKFLRELEK